MVMMMMMMMYYDKVYVIHNTYVCLPVCSVLSSLSSLPSWESFGMLFCVTYGNVDVIEM